MSAVLLGDPPVESPEWWALRANGIGGSEVAAILGLSPWQSAFAVWHRKRGTISEQSESASMNWGKRLEPVICEKFAEDHPEYVVRSAGMYAHADRPWQLASVDRLLYAGDKPAGILETKTADKYDASEWGESGTDEIPAYYRTQGLWYGDTLDLPWIHFAVLIGGNDYREYVITPAQGELEWIRAQVAAFWQSILDNRPPPLDSSQSTYEAVRQLHPEIDGTEVALDPELYVQWENAAAEIKRLKAVEAFAKSSIADQMGNARYGTHLGERVVVRQSTKGGTPYPKLIPAKKEKDAA